MSENETDATPGAITYALSKPVDGHGKSHSEIVFRAPSTKDVRTTGNPLRFNEDGSFTFDAGLMAKYMVTLSGLPMSTIDEMAVRDFNMAAMELAGSFFAD